KSFNPLEKDEPDTGLSAEEREIGGLGIFLVRKTMDSMEYRRENGFNILTIRKKIR
ncbi:MAG: ATP-binding protein, partial [Clostridia bacterium]|nr:ATP-binding protein [Clostridia bacterium]